MDAARQNKHSETSAATVHSCTPQSDVSGGSPMGLLLTLGDAFIKETVTSDDYSRSSEVQVIVFNSSRDLTT